MKDWKVDRESQYSIFVTLSETLVIDIHGIDKVDDRSSKKRRKEH